MLPERSEWQFPNQATPLGSPAYYAVRFSPPAQRERNALLLAWYELIQQIAEQPHDPGVARVKLDWWREELDMLSRAPARHPLARALQQCGIDVQAQAPLHTVVDAAEEAIRTPQIADDDAFERACRDSLGSLFALLVLLDDRPARDQQPGTAAGAYCAAVERIRRVAQTPHRVPPGLQPDTLRALPADRRSQRIDSLLDRFGIQSAQSPLALPDLPRRLTAMAGAIHKKMRRRGYPVAEQLIDRAPIAHLWTAWRCSQLQREP